jgi:hypothetical protein
VHNDATHANRAGGYRRDRLRSLAQRAEVDAKEVRITGWKIEPLRARHRIKRKNGFGGRPIVGQQSGFL